MRPRVSLRGGGALCSQPQSAAPWRSRGLRCGACPRGAGRCPCCTAPAPAQRRCRQPRPRPAALSPACPPSASCPSSPPAPLSATSPAPRDGTGAHTQVAPRHRSCSRCLWCMQTQGASSVHLVVTRVQSQQVPDVVLGSLQVPSQHAQARLVAQQQLRQVVACNDLGRLHKPLRNLFRSWKGS